MTQDQFIKLGQKGYNHVPVVRQLFADLDTPLSCYVKVARGPYSYLLESAAQGGEKWARYCFLGCDPYAVVILNGINVTFKTHDEEKSWTVNEENPLEALKKVLSPYQQRIRQSQTIFLNLLGPCQLHPSALSKPMALELKQT